MNGSIPPPPSLEYPVIHVHWREDDNHTHEDNNHIDNPYEFRYVVRSPWEWVMNQVKSDTMIPVESPAHLPLAAQQQEQEQQESSSPPSSLLFTSHTPPATPTPSPLPRRSLRQRMARGGKSKAQVPATFRIEVVDTITQRVMVAWHGTSSAFDGLEDKDALVRTIQRCRVEALHLSPPAVLINWDVSLEECRNVVGHALPTVRPDVQTPYYSVLKEPMGSQGRGIYFVRNVDEIHAVIDEHHQRARAQPEVLEALIAAKNRIPSWVLQAEVSPCMLIRDGRKFHIRSYVVIVERPENDEVLDLYLYHEHEVRIAGVAVSQANEEAGTRNPLAHITNGALSPTTERSLISQEPELAHLQESLEIFVAETFAKHLFSDISRRVTSNPPPITAVREFALAGLDLMVTTEGRWYLLEVNVNPAAPKASMATDPVFATHLQSFWKRLVNLVAGQSTEGFHDTFAILERVGVTENT